MENIIISPPIIKTSTFQGATNYIDMYNEKKALLAAIENGTAYTVSAELNNFLKHTDPNLYHTINAL
ncbi:hypothetical protein [Pedobacter glucosidilyticus]|uniref:hypothetical protein n=1 Tax=Pedobacter glucosidilyticus TaxID=1122941 RepID=UPI000479F994|nr:hypothetical protein [Pedobacter glucosidilyticus]